MLASFFLIDRWALLKFVRFTARAFEGFSKEWNWWRRWVRVG